LKNYKNASVLDKYYITTRYPNGLDESLTRLSVMWMQRAIELAKKVIDVVRRKLDEEQKDF